MQETALDFKEKLKNFAAHLQTYVSAPAGDWKIRGVIDILKNIYSISNDTKIISKILEIHIFPALLNFARENKYQMEIASRQNYYPDITFMEAMFAYGIDKYSISKTRHIKTYQDLFN